MGKDVEKSNLFETSHIMILIAYSILSVTLIAESFLMQWEKWALILIAVGVLLSWWLHIRQYLSDSNRLWVYSLLMMATFFFYGTHDTSTFDLAIVMAIAIMLFIMTGIKKLIYLCQFTYYLTMAYELINMAKNGYTFDGLVISRTILHLVIVLMAGWLARVIIDKWLSMFRESNREIEFLTEATTRLDDFLANVSHEIRTPINAVVGLTGVCIERETDPEKSSDLNSIREAGKRVAEQVNDILDYSEIDRRILVRNDEDYMLDSVLHDLVVQLRPYKNPNLELIIDVDPSIPTTMNTDISKLKRILWHLIMNGLKYTNEGGVYVRITSIEEEYGINLNIEVTDTGVGMTKEELERVTERFYQADSGRARMGGGLGLGIPIVTGFVAALSGFMTIDSKPGQGTTVRVSIPQKVIDEKSCMSLKNREKLCLGAYLHFDKYTNPHVREYYNRMVGNIVRGLGVQMHRVDNAESLRRLVSSVRLTHLFIAEEEYLSAPDYIEQLAKEISVVIVANGDFKLPPGSGVKVMTKPFYCFPVAVILNRDTNEEETGMKMLCPGIEALVVDDEPMNLIVAKGIFKRYEMNVTTVASGQEAIDMCHKKRFDIIFMDHMMPGMDGVEAVQRLKSDRTHLCFDVPIVALTANAVSTAREMFMAAGFDGFISKPIELSEMERVLKKVLPKNAVLFEEVRVMKEEPTGVYGTLKKAGINHSLGLQYSQGDEELYNTLLKQFVREAPGKEDNLNKYFAEGDNRNYEILVHAIKSNSRMIGNTSLSEKAKKLEDLAKAGSDNIAVGLHRELIEMFDSTVDAIKDAFEMDEETQEAPKEEKKDVIEFNPTEHKEAPVVFEFTPGELGGDE
ncbi:MAG: response regulator [Lachnospiraceae bacterium]|nr:response regulator [Lachnospiraceae bacterium]